ncbi:MAG: signal recognition particle-docking protein FtsY [Gammaproteobacteria bacterium]|nr:signal recognition particle-docking protein FtsY [Gammaproteobacteria bacterium]
MIREYSWRIKTLIIVFGFKKKTQKTKTQPLSDSSADKSESAPTQKDPKRGLFSRLRQGLSKTHAQINKDIGGLFSGKIDEDLLEALETRLLMADVGVEATEQIIDRLGSTLNRKQKADAEVLLKVLHEQMTQILEPCSRPLDISSLPKPTIILVVGVNGVGKTTTIGKLAKTLQQEHKTVMLAAGDTFRAAAVEQLQGWGERNGVPVISQGQGADSASVIYDAIQAARNRNIDVLIADTAGRLHTQHNLMEELKKVQRVIRKLDATAPHETMLVVDAGTGQNALSQAQQFHQAVEVSGITVTKLDGTAKGGILFAIAKKLAIPVRFIGVGEALEDLRVFDAQEFVRALLAPES